METMFFIGEKVTRLEDKFFKLEREIELLKDNTQVQKEAPEVLDILEDKIEFDKIYKNYKNFGFILVLMVNVSKAVNANFVFSVSNDFSDVYWGLCVQKELKKSLNENFSTEGEVIIPFSFYIPKRYYFRINKFIEGHEGDMIDACIDDISIIG